MNTSLQFGISYRPMRFLHEGTHRPANQSEQKKMLNQFQAQQHKTAATFQDAAGHLILLEDDADHRTATKTKKAVFEKATGWDWFSLRGIRSLLGMFRDGDETGQDASAFLIAQSQDNLYNRAILGVGAETYAVTGQMVQETQTAMANFAQTKERLAKAAQPVDIILTKDGSYRIQAHRASR